MSDTPTMTRDERALLFRAGEVLRRLGHREEARRIDIIVTADVVHSPKFREAYEHPVAAGLLAASRNRFATFYARSDWDDPQAAFAEVYRTIPEAVI